MKQTIVESTWYYVPWPFWANVYIDDGPRYGRNHATREYAEQAAQHTAKTGMKAAYRVCVRPKQGEVEPELWRRHRRNRPW